MPIANTILNSYFSDGNVIDIKRRGHLIECGASNGLSNNNGLFFENQFGWECLNVECSPRFFPQLVQNRPNSTNMCYALSNKTGTSIFKDIRPPASGAATDNGSLQHTNAHIAEIRGHGAGLIEVKVDTLTYGHLLIRVQWDEVEIDVMILDVEGHEVEVLSAMTRAMNLPGVMCIEFPWSGLTNIKAEMDRLGFRFDFVRSNNAYFSNPNKFEQKVWWNVRTDNTYGEEPL